MVRETCLGRNNRTSATTFRTLPAVGGEVFPPLAAEAMEVCGVKGTSTDQHRIDTSVYRPDEHGHISSVMNGKVDNALLAVR